MRHCTLGLLLIAGCAQSGTGSRFLPTDGGARDAAPDLRGGSLNPDFSIGQTGDMAIAQSADMTFVGTVDFALPPDLTPSGKAPGEACKVNADCASNDCLDTFQGNHFCVTPCAHMGDCAGYLNLFCDPSVANGNAGLCVPRSPAHCASCAQDSDCGSLSESCFQAPGDIALACHIDCSIDGANACPSDYTCSSVQDGNTARKLCLPNSPVCLDALGGFCDRISLPENCARLNVTGTCTGQRTCIANSMRYDKCDAMAPQYLANCQAQNPAGCMLKVDPTSLDTTQSCGACGTVCAQGQGCCNQACVALNTTQNCGQCGTTCGVGQGCCNQTCTALNTVVNCGACGTACGGGQGCCGNACASLDTISNCGACGNVCPGETNTSDAQCTNQVCGMTCRNTNYDVDKAPQNGCEVADVVPPGHAAAAAQNRPKTTCDDGDSQDTLTANIPSDSRVHTNTDGFFNGTVGAEPDYFTRYVDGTSDFCENDYSVTLTTTGGGATPCYTCTIITDKMSQSVTVAGNASGTMSSGSGSYSSNSNVLITFVIAKTCNLPVQESVNYSVSYHL